ncbi:MAG: hypothetical protein ACK4V6_14275 [Microthrixaceae bacterium]
MSDLELTEHESDRLRELLHRRADRIQVTTPQFDVVSPSDETPRRTNGRWFAAAAVVLVLAAVGGAWWLSSDDGADRIDSVPAEPTVTVAPQVLEQDGIWRLPEGLDGYQVVGAQDGGSFDSSMDGTPGMLAVDDLADPQRWLMAQGYDELGELPESTREVQLSDQVTASLIPIDGSTWFRLAPTTAPTTGAVVSGSALGFDEAELIGLLTEHLGTFATLTDANSSSAPFAPLLADAGLGPESGRGEALEWEGNGDGGPGSSNQQLQVTLASDDGTEVLVVMNQDKSPPWAVAVRLRLTAELLSFQSLGTPQGSLSVRPRLDLGRNVLENIATTPTGTASSIVAITDDSTWISATPSYMAAADEPPAPLSEDEQLRIINSLRAMSEDEFLNELSELGAEFIGAEPMTTTTMQGGPTSPGG